MWLWSATAWIACVGDRPSGTADSAGPIVATDLRVEYDIQTFRFSWTPPPEATAFEIEETLADGATAVIATLPGSAGAFEHRVPLWTRLDASYVLRACVQETCAESVRVSPDVNRAIGFLKASNPDPIDSFGFAVDVCADGHVLVVGAVSEASQSRGVGADQTNDSEESFVTGAVYVFVRDDAGQWAQDAYLKASNHDVDDFFGGSVAISADCSTIAVGSRNEDSPTIGVGEPGGNDPDSRNSGAVYLFERHPADRWVETAYLKASNPGADDGFGCDVALDADGSGLVVGAYREAGQHDRFPASGAAYTFRRGPGGWEERATLKASVESPGDGFGFYVAISGSGSTVAVSAINESSTALGLNGDPTPNEDGHKGAVYVFALDDETGKAIQEAYLKSTLAEADLYGRIALDHAGDTLAAGSMDDWPAIVIEKGPGGWRIDGELAAWGTVWRPGRVGHYGLDISPDGRTVAVGATSQSAAGDGLGTDPDVPHPDEGIASGAVYVYARGAKGWVDQAVVKASNAESLDFFGSAVALGADALVVGGPGESSDARGVGGDQHNNDLFSSGAVYIY